MSEESSSSLSEEEEFSQATVNKALKTRLSIEQYYKTLHEELDDRMER